MKINILKIKDARRPQTKKEISFVLGLTGYYRNFLSHYAEIASFLHELIKKDKPNRVMKSDTAENAYVVLKKK